MTTPSTPATSTAPNSTEADATPTSAVTQVGLVGHCGFDSPRLAKLAQQVDPDVKVIQVRSTQALDALGPDTLLLINRTLDGGFGTDRGVDLIQRLTARENAPRALLISNHDDAQEAAEQVGARPGFGKNDINAPRGEERLRQAMA